MRLPEGWRAEPAEMPIKVPAGQSSTANVAVIPPAVIAAGSVPVDVTVTDSAGRVVDFERLTLQVAPPVRLTPKIPAEFEPKDGQQDMVVEVRNLTDQPISGTLQMEAGAGGWGGREGDAGRGRFRTDRAAQGSAGDGNAQGGAGQHQRIPAALFGDGESDRGRPGNNIAERKVRSDAVVHQFSCCGLSSVTCCPLDAYALLDHLRLENG